MSPCIREWRSGKSPALVCAIALGACAALGACFPEFQRELFVIGVDGAYPVMLSHTPGSQAGRKVTASSGTYDARSAVGVPTVVHSAVPIPTVVHSAPESSVQSDLSASDQLSMEVESTDTWVQFDGAEFRALNSVTYAVFYVSTVWGRALTIEATVHR